MDHAFLGLYSTFLIRTLAQVRLFNRTSLLTHLIRFSFHLLPLSSPNLPSLLTGLQYPRLIHQLDRHNVATKSCCFFDPFRSLEEERGRPHEVAADHDDAHQRGEVPFDA